MHEEKNGMLRTGWHDAWRADAAALNLAKINEAEWLTYTLKPFLDCFVIMKKGNKLAA